MTNKRVVAARLDIEMYVECPECKCDIDLLTKTDTDGTNHNDGGDLLQQIFPENRDLEDFECDSVVCSRCKTEFDVRELEW